MTIDRDGSTTVPAWTMGDRLYKARRTTGLDRKAFAVMIGVSDTTVRNAEEDRRAVRDITVKQWALATRFPEQWLRTGEEAQNDEGPRPDGPEGGSTLPRLDSNQQPADELFPQVSGLSYAA